MHRLEGIIQSDTFLAMAAETYKSFRASSEWGEQYKWDILSELNQKLSKSNISSQTILSIIELLQKKNPAKGSFVHWSELDNLKNVAMKHPDTATHFFSLILDENKQLADRINEARSEVKQTSSTSSFGAPLIAYILASFNKESYPLFKDEIFRDFYEILDQNFIYGNDIGMKYEEYVQTCNLLQQFLKNTNILPNPTIMDGQDFLYTLTKYNSFKEELTKLIFKKGYYDWFVNDPHSEKPEFIYEQVKKDQIERLSKDEFIDFFYTFFQTGGEIQSGGKRNADRFKKFMQEHYDQFRNYIMQVYKENFNVKQWINEHNQIKYFGKGILTIFLHEVYPDRYTVWNDKTEKGLQKLGLRPKRERGMTDGDYYLKIIETEQHLMNLLPEKQNLFTVDAMMHYIVAELPKQSINPPTRPVQYWKVAPGEEAWNWENCRDNGFIAVGWDKFGDLSHVSREEFEERKNKLLNENTNWNETGVEQLWKFAHDIKPADIIIANKGTTEILGIGKVTGTYYFTPNTRHGHRIPVNWFDTERKTVDEYGWRRTLIPLDKSKFESLIKISLGLPEKREKVLTKGIQTLKKSTNYFWVNQNKSVGEKEFLWAPDDNFYHHQLLKTAQPEDKIIHYSNKNIIGYSTVKEHYHLETIEDEQRIILPIQVINELENPIEITDELYEQILSITENENVLNHPFTNSINNKIKQGYFFNITKSIWDVIFTDRGTMNIIYKKYNEQLSIDFTKSLQSTNLYFEDEEQLFLQIKTALTQGKHIILCGPPGTGKSKLAKHIVRTYTEKDEPTMTTATSSWSTFDTIGGYMPDETTVNRLCFKKGLFLQRLQNENDLPYNEWLIIDEINRADIDKAFGSLFSALTGDRITLAEKIDGKQIEIIGKPKDDDAVCRHRFFIHKDWRIIATMNTFDKASLYEMSYAFMRRFAFINVNIPKNINTAVTNLLERWKINLDPKSKEHIQRLWEIMNSYRILGPAIIEDIIKHMKQTESIAPAIAMYVFPQFEGLMNDDIVKIIKEVYNEKIIDTEGYEFLTRIACDFFDIKQGKFKNAENNP